jgi:GT2 family glycosyltransferase
VTPGRYHRDAVPPTASVVIPTGGRPEYLEVALASIVPQAQLAGAEVIVLHDDAPGPDEDVARRHGATYIALGRRHGLNSARNAAVDAATSDLIIFVDDDVQATPGWLEALLEAARNDPQAGVFGGPIEPCFENYTLRSCGAEGPPITFLELGPDDQDTDTVWGANMAIRRSALDSNGPFDERLDGMNAGDEEDWLRRYRAAGGRVRYVAAARVYHRRAGHDATTRALARAAYHRGRAARRYDTFRGHAPATTSELRTAAGCVWHIGRRRCLNGVFLTAHAAGRLREALRRAT